jgi:DnaK suppressor protein
MATMTHRFRGADRARHEEFERLLNQQGVILRSRKQLLRDGLPFASSGVLDLEEHALDAEEQVLGFSVLEITSRTVHGIETALQRLEAGEFGTCSDCRCRISDARLRAVPFAGRCLACQAKHDIAGVASTRTGSTAH